MQTNLTTESISAAFRKAMAQNLIREEDTALIFYDLEFLDERVQQLKSLFPASALHGVAMKANPLIRILEFMNEREMGVEVASFGELVIALKTGYAPDKIVFDSPVKTMQELEFALDAGVHINADSLSELERISEILKKKSSISTIDIRINPQVGVGSIVESSVAGTYSKFGVPIGTKKAELETAFCNYPWLTGVHLHVGSQGCPMELLIRGIGVLYDFANEINAKLQTNQVKLFDIGGGLPVSYQSDKTPVSMEEYVSAIRKNFPKLFTDHYTLFTEFGRWTHVNSGWTASRVEYVKEDPGIKTAMIHTGADLFLRECLLPGTWPHEYSVLDYSGNLKTGTDSLPYNLAGPLCFSGDILAKNVVLPVVEEGDYIVVHDTGGYTLSMWSRYNSRQIPRVIGYDSANGSMSILKERESCEQLYDFWR